MRWTRLVVVRIGRTHTSSNKERVGGRGARRLVGGALRATRRWAAARSRQVSHPNGTGNYASCQAGWCIGILAWVHGSDETGCDGSVAGNDGVAWRRGSSNKWSGSSRGGNDHPDILPSNTTLTNCCSRSCRSSVTLDQCATCTVPDGDGSIYGQRFACTRRHSYTSCGASRAFGLGRPLPPDNWTGRKGPGRSCS